MRLAGVNSANRALIYSEFDIGTIPKILHHLEQRTGYDSTIKEVLDPKNEASRSYPGIRQFVAKTPNKGFPVLIQYMQTDTGTVLRGLIFVEECPAQAAQN